MNIFGCSYLYIDEKYEMILFYCKICWIIYKIGSFNYVIKLEMK